MLASPCSDLLGRMTGCWLVLASPSNDLLGRMTGLCPESDRALSLQSGVWLEALECPESLLTLSVSWKVSWSTVLVLVKPLQSLPCDLERGKEVLYTEAELYCELYWSVSEYEE